MNSPVRQRVVEEASELRARLGKLSAFVGTAPFLQLDEQQRSLLVDQAVVMRQYLQILEQRLELMK